MSAQIEHLPEPFEAYPPLPSREDSLLMLYRAAITACDSACSAISERDYGAKSEAITRLQSLLMELRRGLDFEQGGELATLLDGLYGYMLETAIAASIHMDDAMLADCRELLSNLEDSWRTALTPN